MCRLGSAPKLARRRRAVSNTERPLWEVMRDAYLSTHAFRSQHFYAAELRAIAKWIRQRHPLAADSVDYIGTSLVAAELLTEADRAEAGE
jgi:hypothetical protein